jgi:hypothetical protein
VRTIAAVEKIDRLEYVHDPVRLGREVVHLLAKRPPADRELVPIIGDAVVEENA